MRVLIVAALAALALLLPETAAFAQSDGTPASSGWFDSYKRSDNQRAIDTRQAEDMQRVKDGGFGPSTSTTNVQGDLNQYVNNSGPQNTSTAYNSVNSSSTTVGVGDNSPGVLVTVDTGQTVTGDTTQNANADSNIGSATTNCGGNGSCATN